MQKSKKWLSSYNFGDIILSYELDTSCQQVGIRILPKGMEGLAVLLVKQ